VLTTRNSKNHFKCEHCHHNGHTIDRQQDMIDEMHSLQSSGTWELSPLPGGKTIVGC